MKPAVSLAGLRVAFHGREVLRGIDLEVPAGGPTVLMGRSGCGKSTLLRAVNRLNDCFPGCRTSGRTLIRLEGRSWDVGAGELPLDRLRRKVGMVFQTPNLLPASVARNIALPLEAAATLSKTETADRIEEALTTVGLWDEVKDRLNRPASDLSGGQAQRLCLARALALSPEILLLDEPTASLDRKSASRIEDLVLSLAATRTLLVVSHSPRQARRLAQSLLVMRDGGRVDPVDKAVLDDKEAFAALLEDLF